MYLSHNWLKAHFSTGFETWVISVIFLNLPHKPTFEHSFSAHWSSVRSGHRWHPQGWCYEIYGLIERSLEVKSVSVCFHSNRGLLVQSTLALICSIGDSVNIPESSVIAVVQISWVCSTIYKPPTSPQWPVQTKHSKTDMTRKPRHTTCYPDALTVLSVSGKVSVAGWALDGPNSMRGISAALRER